MAIWQSSPAPRAGVRKGDAGAFVEVYRRPLRLLWRQFAALSPRASHPTLLLVLFTLTARHFHASAGPCVHSPGLHGIYARGPPAADVSAPPIRLARRPARRSRPASAMRSPPGAGRGGCRSLCSILTGMVGGGDHSRRNAEQLGGSGGCSVAAAAAAAAAVGPLAAARSGASRCESVLCLPSAGRSWARGGRSSLQRRPAHVRRPCRCNALVCALFGSCRGVGRACKVCGASGWNVMM